MWKEIQNKSSSSNAENMLLELERQRQTIKTHDESIQEI
jgi:hypothetical protein